MPFVLLYKPGLCISLYKYSKLLEFITLVRVDFFLLLCWLDVVMLLCGLWGDDDKVCYVNREFWGCGGIMVQKCSFLLFFVAFFHTFLLYVVGWLDNNFPSCRPQRTLTFWVKWTFLNSFLHNDMSNDLTKTKQVPIFIFLVH